MKVLHCSPHLHVFINFWKAKELLSNIQKAFVYLWTFDRKEWGKKIWWLCEGPSCNRESQVQIRYPNKYCVHNLRNRTFIQAGFYIRYAFSSSYIFAYTCIWAHMSVSCVCVREILLCQVPQQTLFDFDFSFLAYRMKTVSATPRRNPFNLLM